MLFALNLMICFDFFKTPGYHPMPFGKKKTKQNKTKKKHEEVKA